MCINGSELEQSQDLLASKPALTGSENGKPEVIPISVRLAPVCDPRTAGS